MKNEGAAASDEPSMTEVDARGLKCPLPVLHTRKALRRMAASGGGGLLRVLCTDPVSVIDIPHLAHEMGARVLETGCEGGVRHFIIRPAATARGDRA